jgi:ketosteroid isomerase-like protein
MSEENVERVRQGFEASVRGDWEAFLAGFDPGVEWIEMPSLGPDASTYVGTEAMREAMESWFGMWTDYSVEVSRYADSGDDVVVLAREQGKGPGGIAVERELGEVFTLRDGKAVRVRLYGSWAEALEAAGLSE